MVRISTHELEMTVSFMVKSYKPNAKKLRKPAWWPVELDYQFPLKRHPSVHINNWREILRNLITKCTQFNNTKRHCSKRNKKLGESSTMGEGRNRKLKRRILANKTNISATDNKNTNNNNNNIKTNITGSSIGNARVRRHSTGSSNDSTISSDSGGPAPPLENQVTRNSSTIICGGGGSSTSLSEVSAAAVLVKNLGLSLNMPTPFVQVYDVCKVNPSILINNNYINKKTENCDVRKRDIKVEKNNFMNYFGLNSTKSESVPSQDKTENFINIHKSNLHKNNIPFSSNIGLKLMQGCSTYNTEAVEKRLERLERYLGNSDLPSLLAPITEEFKVLNNKNSSSRVGFNHFYIFPTKKRHRKGKLTPKARFLLTRYCKPCFVNLSKCGDEHIRKYFDSKKQNIIAFIDLTNTEKVVTQKENKTPFTLLESRVVLTTIDDKFKENSLTSSLVKKSDRSNFALQTLAPRNENLVVKSTNSVQQSTKLANFINPSVVLQPIHELFDFSNRDKILNSAHKISHTPYKIVKTRVNVYNPRRFSTRLINM